MQGIADEKLKARSSAGNVLTTGLLPAVDDVTILTG
jgi:hypothetical protein